MVRGRFENQRVAVVPMEGAAVAVVPGDDGLGHQVTLHLACQMPHMTRMMVAGVFGIGIDELRVIAPHVGGLFGARLVGRGGRLMTSPRPTAPCGGSRHGSENLVGMSHGRAEGAVCRTRGQRDGTIVRMRCRVIGDTGAYPGFGGMLAWGSRA